MSFPACALLSDEPIARALDAFIAQPHHTPHLDTARQALADDGAAVRAHITRSQIVHDSATMARAHRYAEAVHDLHTELDRLPRPAAAILPTLFGTYLAARQGLLGAFGVRTATRRANAPEPVLSALPAPAAPALLDKPTAPATPSIDIWLRSPTGWEWMAKDCSSIKEAITILAERETTTTPTEIRITTSTDQAPTA